VLFLDTVCQNSFFFTDSILLLRKSCDMLAMVAGRCDLLWKDAKTSLSSTQDAICEGIIFFVEIITCSHAIVSASRAGLPRCRKVVEF
jgi:hypothetical protein